MVMFHSYVSLPKGIPSPSLPILAQITLECDPSTFLNHLQPSSTPLAPRETLKGKILVIFWHPGVTSISTWSHASMRIPCNFGDIKPLTGSNRHRFDKDHSVRQFLGSIDRARSKNTMLLGYPWDPLP